MATPEERREEQLWRMHLVSPYNGPHDLYYDALLKHFDENEPAVADAIRYGLEESAVEVNEEKYYNIRYPT
jgi:hypothetical protein